MDCIFLSEAACSSLTGWHLAANMNKNFMGRLLAGFANSLLTGNVYMAECAPSHLVPSLKQVEVMSFDVFPF